jgi:hypothetical protein
LQATGPGGILFLEAGAGDEVKRLALIIQLKVQLSTFRSTLGRFNDEEAKLARTKVAGHVW